MPLFALSPFWNDFFSVSGFAVGVLGVLIGVAGFGYTIYQVRKTQRAVDAAREAATKAIEESRRQFHRYQTALANRLLSEATMRFEHEEWQMAAVRANDLADIIAQLADAAPQLGTAVDELRDRCQRLLAQVDKPNPRVARQNWNALMHRIQREIDRLLAPFSEG